MATSSPVDMRKDETETLIGEPMGPARGDSHDPAKPGEFILDTLFHNCHSKQPLTSFLQMHPGSHSLTKLGYYMSHWS